MIVTLILSIAATAVAGTGVIVLRINGIRDQIEALQRQATADRAEAAADREAWQETMDAFLVTADDDRKAFIEVVHQLSER